MGNSCSIDCYTRNSKGEVVVSKLWNDLLHHLSSRELAKEFYGVGTNEEFLNKVRDKAKFDENGEITFNSLRKLANIDVKQEKLLDTLNKDIGSGIMNYDEALSKLTSFNRNSQFKNDYMATIKRINSKYELSVIPRTKVNEASLEQEISNRTLRDRIMYYLNKAGVSVEFLENDDKENGRYSTVNAKKTADGMYNLIRVANGEKVTASLAEEAGHFAIAALGNSPLVNRLNKLLTPEVQRKIYGDEEYNSKILGSNGVRETAGYLVGKAIMNEVDKTTPWGNLVGKITNLAKRIFNTIKGDTVSKAILEAENQAKSIARDFMSDESQGSIDEALKIKETLYSGTNSLNTKVFRTIVNNLVTTSAKLKSISNDVLTEKVNAIINETTTDKLNIINAAPNSTFSDSLALDGIAEALVMISDMIGPGKEINNLLDSVDFFNTIDFYTNMSRNGKTLNKVHTFLSASVNLQNLISESIKILPGKESLKGDVKNISILDSVGNIQKVDLEQVVRELAEANSYILAELAVKEKQFFLKFCENMLGSKYIYRSARVIWNLKHQKINLDGKTKSIFLQKGKKINVSDMIEYLESDINIFERYLGSMSNNPDVIGQIADRATKMANKMADDITNTNWDELRILKERFNKIKGIKQADLYEKFDDGTLTGNIISPYNYGEYERDFKEFKDSTFESFKASTPNYDTLTEFEKAIKWGIYFKPLVKDWHKNHSTWSDSENHYVPNDMYKNDDFNKIMNSHKGLREWYDDYMLLKKMIDSRLPEGSTLAVRMPQFKGSFTNIIRNQTSGIIDSTKFAFRSKLRDTFCESSEDTDFGSDMTYNSEEEERFANTLAHEKEKIHRLPIYGVNKLSNMNELSTDIFHSTLAYAGMANTYLAMSQVVDVLNVGKEVLTRRKVGGDYSENERALNKSKAFNRYIKFLDKQVYGIASSKTVLAKNIVLEKVIGAITNFASKYFLGGNVAGGTVNTLTGLNEIFKEAISEEHFTLKDFKNANLKYFGSFGKNWWNYGKEFKEDKVNLFIRHFNIRGENRGEQRTWYTTHPNARRIYNMFNESIFLPYKTGDHYMQSISYLALASKIKLYDEKGNRMSLFEAYKVKDNEDVYGNKGGKTLVLEDKLFKTKDDIKQYKLVSSILSQLESSSGGPFGGIISLTAEQQDYINNKGYNLADTKNTIFSLKDDLAELTWNFKDESAFMDKCREINNRLHGIYNRQDKVAFTQNLYGNALLAMRGYALGFLERRYSTNHYSIALGHDIEGSISTLGKVIWTFLSEGNIMKGIRAICLPISKQAKLDMYKAGFSANQVANMRRNFGDAMFICLFMLLKALTAKGDDDDDDISDDSQVKGLVYYFSSRLLREQSAYNTPKGAWTEATTITDVMPVGISALVDIWKLAEQTALLPFADEDNSTVFYQSNKEDLYEKGDAKAYVHFWRMFPYLRSRYVFNQPYEAAKSYDYGQQMRAR